MRLLGRLVGLVADYTIGTAIVVAHLLVATRLPRGTER
jgi:hypothetical protein